MTYLSSLANFYVAIQLGRMATESQINRKFTLIFIVFTWPVSQCIMSVVLAVSEHWIGTNETKTSFTDMKAEWNSFALLGHALIKPAIAPLFSQIQMQCRAPAVGKKEIEPARSACNDFIPLHQRWGTKQMILSWQKASNLSLFSYSSKKDDKWSKYKELARKLKKFCSSHRWPDNSDDLQKKAQHYRTQREKSIPVILGMLT